MSQSREASQFQLRSRQEKQNSKSGNQEHRKEMQAFSISFSSAHLHLRVAKLDRIRYQRQITTYETNNTSFFQQYRRWVRSSFN